MRTNFYSIISQGKYFIATSLLVVISSYKLQGASITLNAVYNAGTPTSKVSTTTLISGNSFKFSSVNPADVQFSAINGNDIAGQLTYTSGGQNYSVNGIIQKQVGQGQALVFIETTVLGGTTYTSPQYTLLLVVPGNESSFTTNGSYNLNAAFKVSDLNTVLNAQSANVAPVIDSNGGGATATISVPENITGTITTVHATDANSNLLATPYSITGGTDAGKFSINGTSGALSFISSPDYENPGDADKNNVYNVQVTAVDAQGATDIQDISITVINVNDNTPVITSSSSVSVLQETTYVTTITATDADQGSTLSYSITGGTNASLFSINTSTGVLSLNTAPVFGVGPYQVTVRVSDGLNTTTQTINVFITSSDTTAPTVNISTSDNNLAANETCTISFKFSEQIQNFTRNDITFSGGTLGTTLTQSSNDPTLYSITFTKNSTAESTTVGVVAGSYQDMSNNNGTAGNITLTYDVVAPTVTVTSQTPDMAYGETQLVTFTFSENPGATFTINDINVSNGTVSNLIQTGTPTVWTVSLKAISATTAPSLNIIAGSYTDAAGNQGVASSSLSLTLASPSIDLANNSTVDTGISSTDNVTKNQKPILEGLVSSGTTSATIAVTSANITYTYTVIPSGGTWTLNLNTASTSQAPSLPSSGLAEGYVGIAITTNGGATASSSFLIDITAPVTPTVNGLSSSDNTPTISGTATLTDNDILKVTVNNITYTIGDGNLTYNNNNHTWSLNVPDANTLLMGNYNASAYATDFSGNTSATGNGNITITANKWNGTGNWNTPASWSAGSIPNPYSTVIVNSGILTIDQDINVRSFTIGSNAGVTLNAGNTMTINGDFILGSDANGTGSFIDNGGTLSVTGSITAQLYLKSSRNWSVSSPLSLSPTSLITGIDGNTLYSYNEPDGKWENVDTYFGIGKGYIANLTTDNIIGFTGGIFNTGNKTINLTHSESNTLKPGFNLIGNPYPSYVNAQTAINTSTNLETSMWYLTKNKTNFYVFDTFNTLDGVGTNNNGSGIVTGILPPMQSVWVKVAENNTLGQLTFTNSMRLHNTTGNNPLKVQSQKQMDKPLLRLTISDGTSSDETIVLFNSSASNGFDAYDSRKMFNSNNAPEIYTLAGSVKCAINGLTSYNNSTMALGFITPTTSSLSIKATEIANFDPETKLVLMDNITNTEQDITSGETYTFNSDATSTSERFTIRFKTNSIITGTKEQQALNLSVVAGNNGKLIITTTENSTVSVYDCMGQLITTENIRENRHEIKNHFISGIYIVKVNTDGTVVTKKVVIK